MQPGLRKYAIITLLLLAVVCGLIWRWEVEYHGWTGLGWLGYFHFAIPAGFCLFLCWANVFALGLRDIDLTKRIYLNVTAILFGLVMYILLKFTLIYYFVTGPSAMMVFMHKSAWEIAALRSAVYVVIPMLPLGVWGILLLFGQQVALRRCLMSIAGMCLAFPLSVLLLTLVNHKGGHDTIHAIKSGMVIPFWVLSVGYLLLAQGPPTTQHTSIS